MQRVILTLFLCFSAIAVSAIDILRIHNITDREGLSQNTIRCMMQDSKGFMWMGTINGLNRYNGKEFMTIQPQAEFSTSLRDNRIRNITEDKNGHIWIHTFSNTFLCYDPRLEKFIDYDPGNESKTFSNIMFASNDDIWLWGSQGCSRLRYKNGTLNVWNPPLNDNGQHTPVTLVFEDSKSRIWIIDRQKLSLVTDDAITPMIDRHYYNVHESKGKLFFVADGTISVYDEVRKAFLPDMIVNQNFPATHNRSCLLNDGLIMIADGYGIYIFDTEKMKVIPADHLFNGEKLRDASFHIDNKGHVWVYNMSGILWRHNPDNTFKPLRLIPSDILSLINSERYQVYQDSRGIIWITTFGNGLFAIDENNGEIHHYTTENELSTDYLFCITEDSSGEIWVGTELGGVIKISLTNYPFEIFYPTNKESVRDRSNAVRMIYQDREKRYWFGTRDGNIHVYDSLLHHAFSHRVKDGLPFAMAEDTLGHKFLGTKGGGLLVFSPQGNQQPQIYHLQEHAGQSSSSDNIFTVMRDSKDRIWLASFGGGLHLAERHGGKLSFRQFYFYNSQQNRMRTMIQDKTGLVWVGTNEGIIVFNPDELLLNENNYISLYVNSDGKQAVNSNEVRIVFEDSKQRIWLGSTGGGLNLLVREEPLEYSSFKHYNADNGLSNEMIQAIREDDEGYIWLSTESGISKFDPETEQFENFTFSNNRHEAVFNEQSTLKKENGELMFGSYNGVYIFNPSDISYDTYAPQVLITELRVNGNSVKPGDKDSPLKESIVATKTLYLEHNQNSFNLECIMLNLQMPEFNQYTYCLEGYEKNWNPISRNNIAAYRNVPPGSYLFKVKGCNSFGVWSDKETSLQIVIRPPWWNSGWAIFIYIVLLALIAFFASRLIIRMHRLNMAVEIEKQLTEYKLRFFTNISHEFRTPLTIIRGAVETLNSQKDLSSSAVDSLKILAKSSSRLMRLIDQLLEFRRLQNGKMELQLEYTEPNRFFYDIYMTFREMAEKKQIEYVFEPADGERQLLLDKNKMDKVAYNLLSNAFKHTPVGGKIVMGLQYIVDKDLFTLSVSDSGEGVPHDQRDELFVRFKQINHTSEGTGVGLHLTSELVKIHKGSVIYTDSKFGGACFLVSLPLADENYDKADIIDTQSAKVAIAESASPIDFDDKFTSTLTEKPAKEYKVMVIEDDDEVRGFVAKQIESYFAVSTAINGSEALKQIAEEQPDIVVCDVMMPRMDGFEFTKRLKSNFETSHIPVILLTAYSSEEHRLEGIRSGADAYVTKPFSVKYLLTRILKLLESREQLRRKFNTEPGLLQSSIAFTDRDKAFLDKLHQIIEENISNVDFKVESFAQTFGMGRTTFFRKMKGITGYAPNEYLRIIRLKKAAELLMDTDLTVSEISYRIGMNDPFYLSKCFKAQFGKSPSQYRKKSEGA